MKLRFPIVRPVPTTAIRPHPGRPRPRHHLTGVALAGILILTLGGGRGGPAQRTAGAESAATATGHAQVIAQAVVDLPDGALVWTVAEIDAGEQPTDLAGGGDPGFVLGSTGTVVVRDGANARTRLAGGEALTVRPEGGLTVQTTGEDQASVSLLSLAPAEPNDLGDALRASEAFASPGGSRDIDLVGDVLAEGETARIAASAAPTFVLVTAGAVAIEQDADETHVVQAGDTALVLGSLVVTGAAEDPSDFVAAVIGADVDATG